MFASQYNIILWNVHSNKIPHCTRSGGGKEVVQEERISVFYGNHLQRPSEKDLWGKLFSLGGGVPLSEEAGAVNQYLTVAFGQI